MIISYNWLSEYLPSKIEPERLSKILTAIGLEVESLHKYETIKGGLKGLITAEIMSCEKHPDADKLQITKVNTGTELLQVVCGAPNAAAGQKVILATVGATIHTFSGDAITIKKAKIRGVESNGMICAEDEIGLSQNHEGILVLPENTLVGLPAASLFETYEDFIFEIGLTPNRMDAMSHLGVARDVCAYLSHHDKSGASAKLPYQNNFKPDSDRQQINVVIEDNEACRRYSGVRISNITVAKSPSWLQQKLLSIGLKPINNIVDITNFILHETGQPLHAFDAAKIAGKKIIVKKADEDASFACLDDKVRKLSAGDLMICNEAGPMCIAGVYGGAESGVKADTTEVFLESAWFAPTGIRKTSIHHGLRTDAAIRFEKGVDISQTVTVLKRAALLIKELCGGEISSDIIDVFPNPAEPCTIGLKYHYLKKLSGKNYHGDAIKNIFTSLGFEVTKEGIDEIWVNVPFSKPDISIPADLVEEIMRIDGLDNIDIPATISLSPSIDSTTPSNILKEKAATMLAGNGFYEIFTNSITNSAYFDEAELTHAVKMINNLSADLDMLRPSLLPTGLEVIAHNINRKNANLCLFEFGKTYHKQQDTQYAEEKHLSLYVSGDVKDISWNNPAQKADYYFLKGICEKLFVSIGATDINYEQTSHQDFSLAASIKVKNKAIGTIGLLSEKKNKQFGIKQPVFVADINWDLVIGSLKKNGFTYKEISKFPSVQRDLSLVLPKNVTYAQVEKTASALQMVSLQSTRLFDIFESEKLGADKKSMAVNFTFGDSQKTLTDAEIDLMMNKIIGAYEQQLGAEIRK